mmetsp:Transcript_15231/g.22462  ORF Transcript_15231/g.22462 Transcript_15231/m.22462 type:complete len:893 (-) Transcript_15231:29-2707(-)
MTFAPNTVHHDGTGRRRPRLDRELMERVKSLRQLPGFAEELSERGVSNDISLHGRNNLGPEADLFDMVGKDIDVTNTFGGERTGQLVSGAIAVTKLMNDDDHSGSTGSSTAPPSHSESETLPLTVNSKTYGTERKTLRKSGRTTRSKRRHRRSSKFLSCFRNFGKGLIDLLFASTLTYVAFPCLSFAAILFYLLGNPIPAFLPGRTTASWFLIFFARQSVTYESAKLIQSFIVNKLALRNKKAVKMFGPLLTLSLIQNQGWSLTCIFWALADLILLHGDGAFQQHWLYVYNISMFSDKNKGGSFLESEFYLSILISVFLVGVVHSIKNTILAINFGKNMVGTYKKRQDKLLSDFVILTEVATLADKLKSREVKPSSARFELRNSWNKFLEVEHKQSGLKLGALHRREESVDSPMFEAPDLSAVQEETFNENEENDDSEEDSDEDDSEDNDEDDSEDDDEENDGDDRNEEACNEEEENSKEGFSNVGSRATTLSFLKQNLDQWVEPKNMAQQMNDVSIADILKFHKAHALMKDANNPLFKALENVGSRNIVIKRSQIIYQRLVKATKSDPLHYDIIQCLAINHDNTIDEGKEAAFRSLFRPDFNDQLTLLQFVQAFDNVYKTSKVYDAAVSNSSIMNEVLGGVVDRVVWFFLMLVILLILQYNPYPLLMSMSSLLVSFAFAMGPSASKFIEGILLIAIRRPYDIGDRIILSAPASSIKVGEDWIVEDINLWTTKVRHAATNKVSCLQNGYIAALSITNCNQSPNALINLELKVDIKTTNTHKLKIFRENIEDYIKKRPRSYVSLVYFRCDDMDSEQGWARFSIRVRHRLSWQSDGIVRKSRSELLWRCKELCKETGMEYLSNINEIMIIGKEDGLETIVETTADQDTHTEKDI